jgi:predicted small lipoprotein YifL
MRRTGATAWLLALTMALTACGQGGRKGPNTTPAADQQEAGRRYAQCMRDNGVPDFPDPDGSGEFRGEGHERQDDPTFQAALEKCRDLAPGGEHENTGDPASVEQTRKYAQCMRDNGVPDFPDPDADGRLRGAGHEQQDDPTFRAASETCRPKLPGGGDHS